MSYVIPEGKDTMGELLGLATSIVSEGTFPRPTIINSNNEITNIESTHDSTMYYVSTIVAGLDETDYPRMYVSFKNSFASVNDIDLRPTIIDNKDGTYLFLLCFCSSINESSFSQVSSKLANTLNNVNNKNSNERTFIQMLLTGGGWYNLQDSSLPNNNFPDGGWVVEYSNNFFITKKFPHETIKNVWYCNDVSNIFGSQPVYFKNGEVLINSIITNVPIFDNNDSASKWILYGDRSEEIIKIPSVDYTLFIDGDRLPNYNLNWNPDGLGDYGKNSLVNIEFRAKPINPLNLGTTYFYNETVPFTDGFYKFNWSEVWQKLDVKIAIIEEVLTNEFTVVIHSLTDVNGKIKHQDNVSVNLFEKKKLNGDLYSDLVSPSNTGDTLTIDFGEGKDSDDYYDTDSGENDEHSPTTGYDIGACNLTACYELSIERLNNIAIKLWSEDFFSNILLLNNSPIENIRFASYHSPSVKIRRFYTELVKIPIYGPIFAFIF